MTTACGLYQAPGGPWHSYRYSALLAVPELKSMLEVWGNFDSADQLDFGWFQVQVADVVTDRYRENLLVALREWGLVNSKHRVSESLT